MNLKLFIDRPILSCCIAVLMLIFGGISVMVLPMEQYPDIAPPQVMVSASYTGASAETVMKSVIQPLEESINGVEDMLYITSTATNSGDANINVYFRQGTNADMAAVNVQNRVSKVQGQLPSDVTKSGVTTEKRQSSQLKIICLYSPDDSYDMNFLSNYAKINLVPEIQRVQGVGGVTVLGADYAMRIWLNPQKMLQYGLIPSDISTLLSQQNLESPTGTLGESSNNTFLYTLKYRGRFETPEEYGEMVLKSLPDGQVLKLKDVATIELGVASYGYISQVNGHPGIVLMVMQSAGSNANEIIMNINELEKNLRQTMPKGMELADLMSAKDFLDASIHEVVKTLIEALILVVIVVFLFLQSLRSTVIPAISVIVSLVCTFAFIYVAGFSINLLTLFALVLVIGTVVDDAIVVVEAVQAKFEADPKISPYKATVEAMSGISSAIITTSLVFMSVFVPVCFISGTSGTFYTQFGATMAAAVGISAINALTLSPALCALFMRPAHFGSDTSLSARYHLAFESAFSTLTARYKGAVEMLLKRKILVLIALAVAGVALSGLMKVTKTGLIPDEDTGTLFVSVTAPPGYTLSQTDTIVSEVNKRLQNIEEIELLSRVTGYNLMAGGASYSGGTFIIRLKNWEEREGSEHSKDAVIQRIYGNVADITNAQIFAFAPPMIMGYGTSNGIEMYVQDKKGGSIDELNENTLKFIAALRQRPEIMAAVTTFNPRFPQYRVTVDAARCLRLGVSPSNVLSTLAGYVGGSYMSDINLYSKLYKVMVQASPNLRLDTNALNNMFVSSSSGKMLPLTQFIDLEKVYGPEMLSRFNLFSSISVNVSAAEGYSSGDALKAVSETAQSVLPSGYSYELGGMSRDEASQGSTTTIVYILCLVFVYIILCCLYESVVIPLSVMLSIPFAMVGAFLGAYLAGLENNVYMQTGLIMLMGLISKTAILLTQFAVERRREGLSIVQSALVAAGERLRPILMTSICMIVGLMPLVLASGAGANGSRSLGTGVVCGMLVGIVCLLLVTPITYVVCQTIQEKWRNPDEVRE
ncbi:MAG: efflux RND transporter permease subunit [Succinivibrio sp.]|nr:efflux RND transporter permease subunit [Succinivibrio sp.]